MTAAHWLDKIIEEQHAANDPRVTAMIESAAIATDFYSEDELEWYAEDERRSAKRSRVKAPVSEANAETKLDFPLHRG
jgi:hypothetical protein